MSPRLFVLRERLGKWPGESCCPSYGVPNSVGWHGDPEGNPWQSAALKAVPLVSHLHSAGLNTMSTEVWETMATEGCNKLRKGGSHKHKPPVHSMGHSRPPQRPKPFTPKPAHLLPLGVLPKAATTPNGHQVSSLFCVLKRPWSLIIGTREKIVTPKGIYLPSWLHSWLLAPAALAKKHTMGSLPAFLVILTSLPDPPHHHQP